MKNLQLTIDMKIHSTGKIFPWATLFFLGVLNTRIQDVENSKPVFDPDIHTELIIKDEYEDCNSGNMETYIIIKKISINYK